MEVQDTLVQCHVLIRVYDMTECIKDNTTKLSCCYGHCWSSTMGGWGCNKFVAHNKKRNLTKEIKCKQIKVACRVVSGIF